MMTFRRHVLARLNFWTLAGLLFLVCALVYGIFERYNLMLDATEKKMFTLSAKTQDVLESLGKETLQVKAFFKDDQPGRVFLEDLLRLYAEAHPSFRYEFVDPDRKPGEAKRYGVDEYGTVIVEKGERKERFTELTEEALTNAILKLAQARQKTVAFVTGHGEKLLSDEKEAGLAHFRGRLESENYVIRELVLARDAVPSDIDVLVAAGPTTDWHPEEIKILSGFIEAGGHALLLLDPVEAPLVKLAEWLTGYGVILGQDVVIDKLSRLFGADYLIPVVTSYGDHPVTRNYNVASFLPFTQSVTVKDPPQAYHLTELAFTSQGSWAERDWEQIKKGQVSFSEGDLAGPVCLAVAAEKQNSDMRLVIFGDSDFADNAHFYLSGNKDLVLNTVAWLSGEEKLVTIRPKAREASPLLLSESAQKWIFAVPVFALPLLSLSSGVAVVLYRRKYA
jgi:ABC-type uncharacterized transport system involved in gliding motility auxiliary subunit